MFVTHDYIPFGQSRSGEPIGKVVFDVAHATGNPGSTARGNVNWYSGNPVNASAHTFIDDIDVINDIPLWEKAYHVRYNTPVDNEIYGCDANDNAIGVEWCFGGDINFKLSYKNYVNYFVDLCKAYGHDPAKDIAPHSKLDPSRRSDPNNAFSKYGLTYDDFIQDVMDVYNGKEFNVSKKHRDRIIEKEDKLLTDGESGERVEWVQEALIKLGHKLPRYGVDGKYGQETIDAVEAFQAERGLLVDGIVGPDTFAELKDCLDELNNKKKKHSSALLQLGSEGHAVEVLQRKLNRAVHANLILDGKFGPKTEDAVVKLQAKAGIATDGIVGPKTRNVLKEAYNKEKTRKAIVHYPGHLIAVNSKDHHNVKRIQRALNITVDGIFGPGTKAAVKEYQEDHDLEVDGVVGPETWNELF